MNTTHPQRISVHQPSTPPYPSREFQKTFIGSMSTFKKRTIKRCEQMIKKENIIKKKKKKKLRMCKQKCFPFLPLGQFPRPTIRTTSSNCWSSSGLHLLDKAKGKKRKKKTKKCKQKHKKDEQKPCIKLFNLSPLQKILVKASLITLITMNRCALGLKTNRNK